MDQVQLRAEITELRARLEEHEQTIVVVLTMVVAALFLLAHVPGGRHLATSLSAIESVLVGARSRLSPCLDGRSSRD